MPDDIRNDNGRISNTNHDVRRLDSRLTNRNIRRDDRRALEEEFDALVETARNDSRVRVARQNRKGVTSAYLLSLLDPFEHGAAKIPTSLPVPTTTFAIKTSYNIRPGAGGAGEAVFLCKGGIFGFAAGDGISILPSDSVHSYGQPVVQTYPFSGDPTVSHLVLGSPTVNAMVPAPEYASIVGAFAAYRKVSAGMKVYYTGPRLTATGTKAMGIIPGSQQIRINSPAGNNQAMIPAFTELTYDSLKNLEGAEVYPAQDEATILWRPYSDAIEEWRPTKYIPTLWREANSAEIGTEGAPACDGDHEHFKSTMNQAIQLASIGGGPQPGVNPYLQWCYNISDPADGTMVVCFANIQADFSATIECVVNYEAIPDNRTFSLAAPTRSIGAATEAKAARMTVAELPHTHPGTDHGHFLADAGKAIGKIWNTASAVAKGVKTVLPEAASLAEKAGFTDAATALAQAGSVTSIAELAALLV